MAPDIVRLEPADLRAVPIVAQCLDNQWVAPDLLTTMLRDGRTYKDIEHTRSAAIRSEYIRGLLNGEQLLANRAFLYNNPVVYRDFVSEGPNRDAVRTLLATQALIPILYQEDDPSQKPENFTVDPVGWPAWVQLCNETQLPCLRLSWDAADNERFTTERLAKPFHRWALNARILDQKQLLADLGLPADAAGTFDKVLLNLRALAEETENEGKDKPSFLSRQRVYVRFIARSAEDVPLGRFDASKPLAAAIKQLVDLVYNVNLADAMGGYALTPMGGLSRPALQDWIQKPAKRITAADLTEMLRREAFAALQSGLFMKSYGLLTLPDVVAVRRTDSWAEYIRRVGSLLNDPFSFSAPETGAQALGGAYLAMLRDAGRIAAERRQQAAMSAWNPVIELVIRVGATVLSVVGGDNPVARIGSSVSNIVADRVAPVVAKLIIRGVDAATGPSISTSMDILRGQMDGARQQWDEVLAHVRAQGWLERVNERTGERPATINAAADAA